MEKEKKMKQACTAAYISLTDSMLLTLVLKNKTQYYTEMTITYLYVQFNA